MKRVWNIQIFLNRSAFVACAIFATLLSANAAEKSASRKITNAIPDSSSERLEFLDGSTLHGHLRSIDSTNGLKWEHPAALQPILFKPDNVAWVRFPAASQFSMSNSKPTCKFEFANGDEFFGDLVSLDSKELELQTWFGGKFKTPRSMVKLIRFFPKGAATIYEGPSGLEG